MSKLEKTRLVNFVAKIMEESGFKAYKNFQTSRHIIDIYGVLPTILGDIGVVVAVKNYEERWEVGLDVLKEMEMVAKTVKASQIVIFSSSYFTESASNYADKRNIKLINKDGLLELAKKFSKRNLKVEKVVEEDVNTETSYIPSSSSSINFFSGKKKSLNKGGGSSRGNINISLGSYKSILNNTVALIIIVLLLSSLLTFIVSLNYKNTAYLGITKIISSAILSYGLVLLLQRDLMSLIIKGTMVFFASLIIYVILILIGV
ncbi:MAG: restriction endonuclease [Methanobacterium sp.]